LDGLVIPLETEFVFDNQWNTGPVPGYPNGLRVFDHCSDVIWAGNRKSPWRCGYYLELSPEAIAVRADRSACGYCGAQYTSATAPTDGFCPLCLDSAYLKSEDLHLLRIRPVSERFNVPRAPLTDAERAALLPRYVTAQTTGTNSRAAAALAKRRERIERDRDDAIRNAAAEYAGRRFLLDRGMRAADENAIFYTHTGRWCFGWRSPVSAEVQSALLDVLSEFPGAYDVKCADGRTLSGG
jgi:hypothetical protein